MIFWRILDNKVYPVHETNKLGFEKSEGLRIPDEYLEKQEFTIIRTCFGIGDWGILTAMPRLLKQKYPKCKIYLPSTKLLEELFGDIQRGSSAPQSWDSPFETCLSVFSNNPYIDGYKDKIEGEVFHDHYRIYDNTNLAIPLVEQILKFWQFEENEYQDSQPDLYFSKEEKELGNKIIKEHAGDNEFGSLLISNRYDYTQDKLICDLLKENPLPYFYFTPKPINKTDFNFINKALDLRHISIRIQLYIKSKAKINISNHCGVSDMIARYSDSYVTQRQFPHKHNFIKGVNYLDNKFKRTLLKDIPNKTVSKTTTSRKWKSDLIDFFNKDEYKQFTALEVGSSLGHSTRILSHLFKEVTPLDNLAERHEKSKRLNHDRNNINYRVMDVYREPWNFKQMNVVFIDCVHDYIHIKSDIDNSLNTFNKPILVFDDYGLFPDLKKAINEYIDNGQLKLLKYIGDYSGTIYPKTLNKILKDREGLICQAI